jgi:hypothetical protein
MAPKAPVVVPPVAIPEETAPPVDAATAAKAEEVELKVTASKADSNDIIVLASISPGEGIILRRKGSGTNFINKLLKVLIGLTRSPADICCVVDISGSMGTEASIKTGTGKEERHGLSLLDIVKHAVKTVVHSLEANDRFALVVFSTTARVVFDLAYIGQTKDRIFSKVRAQKKKKKKKKTHTQ